MRHQPKIVRRCKNCARMELVSRGWTWERRVISPAGVEHMAKEYSMTACGVDTTPDGWWSP